MKLKKILRVVLYIVYWVLFGYVLTTVILGKANWMLRAAFGFYIGNIILYIIKYAFDRIAYSKTVKNFKLLFHYLTQSHNHRYSCLLKGDLVAAKEFEELIKMCSDAILQVGPNIVQYKEITRKERKEVNEIIDKTKVLINTIQPPV